MLTCCSTLNLCVTEYYRVNCLVILMFLTLFILIVINIIPTSNQNQRYKLSAVDYLLNLCDYLLSVTVEKYLEDIHLQCLQSATGVNAIPTGAHVRDDEQVSNGHVNICLCNHLFSLWSFYFHMNYNKGFLMNCIKQ